MAAKVQPSVLARFLAGTILLAGLMGISPAGALAQSMEPTTGATRETRSARGLLSASMRVELRTRLQAPVAELPFLEGQRFSKDDLLVAFDCSRYEAEEAAAKAGANAAWIDYKSKKRLLTHGAIGRDEVDLAGAKASQASAEVKVHETTTRDCRIMAPFDGLVVSVEARPHEEPDGQTPLMVILDDTRIEVEMVVPSTWLTWLKPGAPFRFAIEETGQTVDGKIDRLSAEIDAVSQTLRVFGILQKDGHVPILAGMSGTAHFSEPVDG